eukprot:CAMPEP_0184046532 /NCGR_PEP_ID=MMETSP0956-20121227/1620_1 /TAXON_ID=627963 /ORGANISM="Aplanochytrium sp, Strain PBS07" /LENGTH=656 /DNA_ID=CAMNT_0026338149 /DNA_START=1 /DNA_END=1971 /DNA_ORIENTATION=+
MTSHCVNVTTAFEASERDIGDVLWRKLSNFHDLSWLFNKNKVFQEITGDGFTVGATRTYPTGGTEELVERNEATRRIRWTLDSIDEYEAYIEVRNSEVYWQASGIAPKEMLEKARIQLQKRLDMVVAESVISADDRLIMEQQVSLLDKYTRTILKLIPGATIKNSAKKTTDAVVKEPTMERQRERQISKVKVGTYTFRILKRDDYYGTATLRDRIVFGLLSRKWIFPIKDIYLDFPHYLVEKFRAQYLFDRCFPPPNQYIPSLESDEEITRMAFYGVLSIWMKDDIENEGNQDGYMCDFSAMKNLKPRNGFRRLGCKAFFDKNGKLFKIHDSFYNTTYKPGQPKWEEAKMLLKVSVGQYNTANDHLIGVHLIASNPVINAGVQNLRKNHPIRRLIQPFCFRSVYVNNRAISSLLDPQSIVSHACGYPPDQVQKLLAIGYERCILWATPQERIEAAGKNIKARTEGGQFPYGDHGIRLYKCFEDFVTQFIDTCGAYNSDSDVVDDSELQAFAKDLHNQVNGAVYYPPPTYTTKEEVVKVIATFMFNATGMHEFVGTVSEYIDNPHKLGFRLRNNSLTVDFQSWLTGMLLFTVTTVPMPKLMSEFRHCYSKDHERKAWKECLKNLEALSRFVEEENQETLEHPFRSFDPQYLECSVNV